jgi:NADH-quinone oxidoreductase subunit J
MEFLVAHGPALLFYLFAGIMVASAVVVITARNPVYGAIALLVTFLAVAAVFLLRHAEFVALVQVFVYGGGIMVLFLLVIFLVILHGLNLCMF